jgi:hypothetical protein
MAPAKASDFCYAITTRIRVGNHWPWTTWMCCETYAEAAAHAREEDKVVRFRSAEWQALRRETTAAPASCACADTELPRKSKDETLVEFVVRLLSFVEANVIVQEHSSNRTHRTKIRHEETQERKLA